MTLNYRVQIKIFCNRYVVTVIVVVQQHEWCVVELVRNLVAHGDAREGK